MLSAHHQQPVATTVESLPQPRIVLIQYSQRRPYLGWSRKPMFMVLAPWNILVSGRNTLASCTNPARAVALRKVNTMSGACSVASMKSGRLHALS